MQLNIYKHENWNTNKKLQMAKENWQVFYDLNELK